MREQLIQYVSLLFAGAEDCEDVKTEILQNTLDRYDDLIAEGRTPEAAYRLAIVGIGDINEILGQEPSAAASESHTSEGKKENQSRTLLRAIGIGLYILCPIPLFMLGGSGVPTLGLCGTIALVAVATVFMVLTSKNSSGTSRQPQKQEYSTPEQKLRKGIRSIIDALGLAIYLIINFATGAWLVTWLVFPIVGALQELVIAIMDLKEEKKHV